MPGQINKALAKTIGSAIDPLFLPERGGREEGGERGGRGGTGGGGIEKERKKRERDLTH